MDISRADWVLYRTKVANWQEAYMERLCHEYAALLTSEKIGSQAFWELNNRIKQDKKSPGVQIELKKSTMLWNIIAMLQDGVIDMGDLDGFSDELIERVKAIVQGRYI